MPDTIGKIFLMQLRKKWRLKAVLSRFCLALAIAVFIASLLRKLFLFPFYTIVPLAAFLFLVAVLLSRQRLNEGEVAGFLNRSVSSLQESAHLFLLAPQSLNLLQKLQVERLENELLTLKAPNPFQKLFAASLFILLFAFVISLALFVVPFPVNFSTGTARGNKATSANRVSEKLLPEIKAPMQSFHLPLIRGKVQGRSGFNLSAEEGAVISWQIQTNVPAKQVKLLFNDGSVLPLTSDGAYLNWKAQKRLTTSGFYQVKIDDTLSDLYKMEAIKDRPPLITIQSPKPNTSITYGQSERILITATVADDYGIAAANLSATVSSGQGEAVKFKQQNLPFENFAAGGKDYHLQKMIDCKALGMGPGDELYFFITASDNHHQQTASEVYIITLPDTAGLQGIDGMVTSLDVKQEFFRSQRQIIIETEALLKSKATTGADQFKRKSNDLGIDQQLLRMRYGKFLGEETETEIGEGAEAGHEQKDFTNNADEIIEQYSHKHDIADDAGFFDPATKKQLKRMLDEMWNAELKLRTFLPKEALVYENRALLLLKDLQQKSRAYVPKTGFTPTPLKLDKRLTGDLSKVAQPITTTNVERSVTGTVLTRRALGILEGLKESAQLGIASKQVLEQAFRELTKVAAGQPSVYLSALSSLKKIITETYRARDINDAETGLQRMLPVAEKLPYAGGINSQNLSRQYFMNISKGGGQ